MATQAVLERHALEAEKVSPRKETTPVPDVMTGEELHALRDIGRCELIQGELVRMSPTGYLHGYVEQRFGKALSIFVDERKLGRVISGEVGIYTRRNPDTVRGADVAFISNERLTHVQPQGFLVVAPELIVEVLSPDVREPQSNDDRWYAVNDKLAEYFEAGVQVVWVADPLRKTVSVYRSLTEVAILAKGDTLTGGDILPGFSAPVAELFK